MHEAWGGPVGKARRIFEEVRKLSQHKQQRGFCINWGIIEDPITTQQVRK